MRNVEHGTRNAERRNLQQKTPDNGHPPLLRLKSQIARQMRTLNPGNYVNVRAIPTVKRPVLPKTLSHPPKVLAAGGTVNPEISKNHSENQELIPGKAILLFCFFIFPERFETWDPTSHVFFIIQIFLTVFFSQHRFFYPYEVKIIDQKEKERPYKNIF